MGPSSDSDKDKKADEPAEQDDFSHITQQLYKKNLELAVKNKTLLILGKLYEISLLTAEPEVMAEKLSRAIQEGFDFEGVAIMLYDPKRDALDCSFISATPSFKEKMAAENIAAPLSIEEASKHDTYRGFFTPPMLEIFTRKGGTGKVFLPSGSEKESNLMANAVLLPLRIDTHVIGVLSIFMVQEYAQFTVDEKEAIRSFASVSAVAIDKAIVYKELKISNAHLAELNRQKSEFVSFASHQLRSPLTSILGNSSLILEGDAGPISAPVKQIIETILEATKTQINIVESYLNSSRIELGTMKYSLIDMDFKTLAEQVMNEQKPNIESKGLTHTLTIDPSQTYKIKADPDKFKQVLMNIVDNSLKYTAKGSVNVTLVKDAGKGVITFKVSDTGVGIRADVMPKLFQKFSRAENANEANIHGTGLGLFIARDIVKAHGGRVWAESEGEGKGSQFYVEVPEAK